MRRQIREFMRVADDLEYIPDRLLRYGVDRTYVKIMFDYFQQFPTFAREGETPFSAMRESFAWRVLLGSEPPTAIRDCATERLRELHAINTDVSMEPISRGEVDQLVDALGCFFGRGHHYPYPYPYSRDRQNDRQQGS
jgi:hypothetical protein